MNVPEEAVEAAARAMHFFATAQGWKDADPLLVEQYREQARSVLTQAAPHLMAPVLALADQWQEDFPYKASQLREVIGGAK